MRRRPRLSGSDIAAAIGVWLLTVAFALASWAAIIAFVVWILRALEVIPHG